MFNKRVTLLALMAVVVASGLVAFILLQGRSQPTTTTSPYAAQVDSPVRGLSTQEVSDLSNGLGAGYARMAELNNYPGPRHLLDIKQQLRLTAEQERQIQQAFDAMLAQTKPLGQAILNKERELSSAFQSGKLSAAVQHFARLYRPTGR